ncbi:insulinase family protein [Pseudoduganella ginsengisoli]|uniref:Peptidase M16 n=1 Tax=Pseudoduganella ginsengisoli TaxID=1462440 RepID=A0A6L6Q8X6_9BURK|nr:insulinase family protein [Pseudoduganella ginsengisoli]MTW05919.1 peptidase M16 [Pseudoduganella ginsengisoli]
MIQFNHLRSHTIPTMQATVDEYVEPASGAVHIHVATTQPDLAFLVGFPTVPDTSDGRAHILEHLALCGSGRYPVRDPFFSMLRRSTATFMNAMTYADRTVYPFASTDRTDFFNLLDVYLDAAFFPNLDYLNFLQEGWRHTLEEGKLGYQGVVFNEMKGAFADPMRALYNGIGAAMLPDTTYEVISGGDPLDIPALTHQMLKDFHASHYHPSQAVFMTAGPIDPRDIQRHIADKVLARLPGGTPRRVPQLAKPFVAPRDHAIRIPSQSGKPDEYGFQLTWLMGESADAFVHYHANLLSAGLLGDASAPLKKAMESAGFGRPSRLNGHDPSARQMLFHVGMEGLTEDQLPAARTRMWDALEYAAQHGVPHDMLAAALRDIRYSQRDTASGRMPNVLGRMLHALPVAMRGGDVMTAFDSDSVLAQLEQDIADPAFFKGLVKDMLASPSRLEVTVVPDPAYFSGRAAQEEAALAAREAALTEKERTRILDDAAALDAHQRRVVDNSVLPRILPSDVGKEPRRLPDIPAAVDGAYRFDIASNGISYARVHYDVSDMPAEDWPWLQLYTDLRRDLGVAGMNYEQAGAWRQRMAATFGVNFDAIMRENGSMLLDVSFAASGLREEHQNLGDVLAAHIASPRFDEHERIAFLVERMVRNRINGLAQSGNRYAALTAAAPLSALRHIEDVASGTSVLPFMAQLQRMAHTPEGVAAIALRLSALHDRIVAGPASVLCAGAGDDANALAAAIRLPAATAQAAAPSIPTAVPAQPPANAALFAPGQVNHCSIAWPAPRQAHADAAPLAVAAELLTHQVLHQALREQGGAYGGSAGYAGNAGVFSMMSYRDPRLAGTYADFHAAIDKVLATDFTQEQIEEAIICVVRGLDRPDSPYDAVLAAWTLHRRGITMDVRRNFRHGVLHCTQDAIKAAVRTWLKDVRPSRAAFVGNTEQDLAGLDVVDMLALVS